MVEINPNISLIIININEQTFDWKTKSVRMDFLKTQLYPIYRDISKNIKTQKSWKCKE